MRKVLEDGKLPLNEMNSLRYLVASAGPLNDQLRVAEALLKHFVLFE
jgi:hypothetical protein